jgi:parallel beta-helix repeat protein
MNQSGVRRFLRLAIVGGALLGVLRPAGAAAQSADIYPWQNIQQVVNGYPAGTTFYLKSGVHRMQTITPRSGDRYIGEGGTVLSGARQLTSFGRLGSYWFAGSQTQQAPVGYNDCKTGFSRCGYPEDLFFDGMPLRNVDSLAAVGPGSFFFDYGADRIYFWDDPTFHTVETSVTAKAFDGYATDVLISGLVIEKFATPIGDAAVPLGTRWILQYSEVKLNHYAGVSTWNESQVLYNSIHHNGCFGITGAGNYATVDSNEIAYNNFAAFNPYWGAGGSKWVYTWGLTVRNNNSHHNGGPGLWTDIGNIYVLYENNTVEDNERGGIFHELSYNATIRNNTARRNGTAKTWPFWSTGAGIEILDSPNVEISGNVLEDNWQGITGLDDHRGSGPYGPYTLMNLNVHDNSITSRLPDAGTGRTGIIDMDGWTAYAAGNNRFTGNRYTLANPGGQYFIWFGEKTQYEWQAYGNDVGMAALGAPVTSGSRYLSDMTFTQLMNGWGPAEKDRSNGEVGGSDGRTLSLDGVTYAKGIGVHSDSQLIWQLSGQCTTFSAVVGVDDEVGSRGSVIFQVYVNGEFRYQTGVITGSTPAQSIQVDVTGANELGLFVHYGWDSYAYDHADWADAKVTCR